MNRKRTWRMGAGLLALAAVSVLAACAPVTPTAAVVAPTPAVLAPTAEVVASAPPKTATPAAARPTAAADSTDWRAKGPADAAVTIVEYSDFQ